MKNFPYEQLAAMAFKRPTEMQEDQLTAAMDTHKKHRFVDELNGYLSELGESTKAHGESCSWGEYIANNYKEKNAQTFLNDLRIQYLRKVIYK